MTAWQHRAAFVGVYLAEAHALDEWPISEAPRDVRQHRSVGERLTAARDMLSELELAPPLAANFYVDDYPSNSFNAAYASWPLRFWVLNKREVLLKPMPKDAMYDLGELEAWLAKHAPPPLH